MAEAFDVEYLRGFFRAVRAEACLLAGRHEDAHAAVDDGLSTQWRGPATVRSSRPSYAPSRRAITSAHGPPTSTGVTAAACTR